MAVHVNDGASGSLRAAAALVDRAVDGSVRKHGGLLLTRVRAKVTTGHHAPGAPHVPGTGPGPNVATGDYRRSWTLAVTRAVAPSGRIVPAATVFTNSAQAWRLERGFVGTDARGRRYTQAAYPHAGPAADEIEQLFYADLARVIAGLDAATSALGVRARSVGGAVTRPGAGI